MDDLAINRILMREIIKGLHLEFTLCENGREAIELLQKENYGMVLMDIEMPVMNGLETIRYIREQMPDPLRRIPVIALTAHNPKIFFEDFAEAGFDEIITKPYSVAKVKQLIDRFI